MNLPLRPQPIDDDVFVASTAEVAHAKRLTIVEESSVLTARLSRRRLLFRLIAANVLVWIVMIALVRAIFF